MKRLNGQLLIGILIILSTLILSIGCGSKSPTTATPSSSNPVDIPVVADPIIENILTGLKNKDYPAFSKDLSQGAKVVLSQTSFDQLYTQMQTALGEYQSKILFSSDTKDSKITAIYVTEYSKEPAGVFITLVLQPAGNGYQIEGLTFDSPNLRGQPLDVNGLTAYANPETENVLISLSNGEYTAFSKDLDQAMKTAFSQQAFDQLRNQMKSSVGDYRSKMYKAATAQNNIATVIYLAEYSNEPSGVWVTISFNGAQQVAGLYFSSPKMLLAQ